jgi:hypothetical protein
VRRAGPALAAVALAAALAGCGTPSPDLFAVERDGSLPDARVQIVVGDDGVVKCDGKDARKPMPDELLLDARQLERELVPELEDDLRLRIPSNALLRYRVVSDEGDIRFADASPGLTPELGQIIQLTRRLAREFCGKAR